MTLFFLGFALGAVACFVSMVFATYVAVEGAHERPRVQKRFDDDT